MEQQRPALTLPQLVGAAERLARRVGRDDHRDWMNAVEDAHDRLAHGPFRARPLRTFRQRDGKRRLLVRVAPDDRIVHECLRPLLQGQLEQRLPDAVHGYRPGRSIHTAAAALHRHLVGGCSSVLCTDVAAFFPSLTWEVVRESLEGLLEPRLAELALELLMAPMLIDGHLEHRDRGIPLGCPLSPAVSNACLLPVDRALEEGGVQHVRYGDDIVLAARDDGALAVAGAKLADLLGRLGLATAEDKTRRFDPSVEPVCWLGLVVSPSGVFEPVARAKLTPRAPNETPGVGSGGSGAHPNRRLQTLYVVTPGTYLRVRSGLVQAVRDGEVHREIPLHRLDRVLMLATGAFSSGFVSACVERRIPVLFFIYKGRAFGSLVSGSLANPLRLRAQYALLTDPATRMELARSVFTAKLQAMLRRLERRRGEGRLRGHLRKLLQRGAAASRVDPLRGLEGAATRAWFAAVGRRLAGSAFVFEGRNRRPPRDPFNSLLSFSYSLLVAEMQTGLLAHGLDPHAGVLHELRRSSPSLAFDLVDPYRPLFGDSFAVGLVNRGQVRVDGFEHRRGGAVYMNPRTRDVVLEAFETFMTRPPGGAAQLSPRNVLDLAARRMLAVVLGQRPDLELPLSTAAGVEEERDDVEAESVRGGL